jgi:hypothetical protein
MIMQDVRVYTDIWRAEADMKKWIRAGWRVHACAASGHTIGISSSDRILVVYEKD